MEYDAVVRRNHFCELCRFPGYTEKKARFKEASMGWLIDWFHSLCYDNGKHLLNSTHVQWRVYTNCSIFATFI